MNRRLPATHAARSAAARRIRFAIAVNKLNCPDCGQRQVVDAASSAVTPHACPAIPVPAGA